MNIYISKSVYVKFVIQCDKLKKKTIQRLPWFDHQPLHSSLDIQVKIGLLQAEKRANASLISMPKLLNNVSMKISPY